MPGLRQPGGQRLSTEERGHFAPDVLLAAGCDHTALGWPDAGTLTPGARADLVTIGLDSVRTAGGSDPLATVVFAATAADVRHVMVDGQEVVRDGRHVRIDVAPALHHAITAVWR
jgi:cytosine/adenosine deaminase-related metal-dependent hydrolase